MIKREYSICAYAPAISKEHNELLRCADLGISGAFRPVSLVATVTYDGNATVEQRDKTEQAIKQACDRKGYKDVYVKLLREFVE